jgi:hypothetical protein
MLVAIKYSLFLSDFSETWIFSTISKNIQISNFMEIRPVWVKLFHANRRTDVTKLIVALSQCLNAPKNGFLLTADLSSLQTCMKLSRPLCSVAFSEVDSGIQGFQSDPPCRRPTPTPSSGFWYRFTWSADMVVGPRGFTVLQTYNYCTCSVRGYSSRKILARSLTGLAIPCATPLTAYLSMCNCKIMWFLT